MVCEYMVAYCMKKASEALLYYGIVEFRLVPSKVARSWMNSKQSMTVIRLELLVVFAHEMIDAIEKTRFSIHLKDFEVHTAYDNLDLPITDVEM